MRSLNNTDLVRQSSPSLEYVQLRKHIRKYYMAMKGVIMAALTTIQPAKDDIIRIMESNTRLTNSTKAQYKKAIPNYLDIGNSLADSEAIGQ